MKINRENIQKKEIINNIFQTLGFPKSYSTRLLNDLINILIINIIKANVFKIKNFGTFTFKKKSRRVGRNPKNKILHEISERNVITFKAANSLKQKINSNA
jgi:integration host factor subunit alpha|tara:strand:+ start:402 stop:704 length:303 start_codon:yes stop_codon:yes gene_type:complete